MTSKSSYAAVVSKSCCDSAVWDTDGTSKSTTSTNRSAGSTAENLAERVADHRLPIERKAEA